MVADEKIAGRYRLLRLCGRGSFGEVWLAQDEQIGLEVAVKVYIALDDRGIEDFKTEFRQTYALNHPNLLHATHFDVWESRPYLVMPYCPASSVSLIGKTDETQFWKFLRDVSSGLAYLHEQDVIHRDIKPDNILIDEKGKFLISDFGISAKIQSTLRRNSTRQQSEKSSGGSLPYMAPELFSSNPEQVKASDIWALGATLYEIIVGELPFLGHGGVMLLGGAQMPGVKGVSKEIEAVVQACLSKETWDRPTAAQLASYAAAKLRGESPIAPWVQGSYAASQPPADAGTAQAEDVDFLLMEQRYLRGVPLDVEVRKQLAARSQNKQVLEACLKERAITVRRVVWDNPHLTPEMRQEAERQRALDIKNSAKNFIKQGGAYLAERQRVLDTKSSGTKKKSKVKAWFVLIISIIVWFLVREC